MQNKKYLLLKITFFLFLLACQDEINSPPGGDKISGDFTHFNIAAAQAYFESHACDLTFLRFSDSIITTRSMDSPSPELIPDWNKALRSTNEEVSLIEIPIHSNTLIISTTSYVKEGKTMISRSIPSSTRLIVAQRKNGQTDMFVVTLVPSLENSRKLLESMANFRYLGGSEFTVMFSAPPWMADL